jgi:Uri superfamily endonuclease
LVESHRVIEKNFETQLWLDGKQLPLNHMMQETLGNILLGFSRTLKGAEESPEKIEVKVEKLHQAVNVDAHTYP